MVSDLERTECRNAILFEDMKISRLVTHAQQVEDDKLRNKLRIIRRQGQETMSILNSNRVVEIVRSFSRILHP